MKLYCRHVMSIFNNKDVSILSLARGPRWIKHVILSPKSMIRLTTLQHAITQLVGQAHSLILTRN